MHINSSAAKLMYLMHVCQEKVLDVGPCFNYGIIHSVKVKFS